ncbi:glycosyltransferase family 4 protein [Patescibacteria group bacterium]|nr:glycosyltransferase family 4 protein [Patescibacteria group bacterium]MBU1034707.1 glycosyltransferase family 4 protein [Patescibacteria group bacterium]MBU1629643.1 glycosyltransferase family 4 protein [Patescibacteria group bacterium]MBU1908206.1 glycosyltransferase family 4 protein [Patescibacteria group bacterium]
MRIGIDARMMSARATRGIGRYIEELIRAMLVSAPSNRYVLITRSALHPFATHPSVETRVADIPWYGLEEQLRLPFIFRALRADVIHVPHWNAPLFYNGPLVITVHDLLLRHQPNSARISTRSALVAAVKRLGFRIVLSRAIVHAYKILVPSNFVADDVARFFPKAAQKIVITGEGITRRTTFPTVLENKPPRSEYLLYVGSAYPHKGLDTLIDAWAELSARHCNLRLKIAGSEDVFMQRLKESVQRRNLQRVDFLGFVKDEELNKLYQEALVFVFPSNFEGFGLPPLEAIRAGCPVVSSDAGALPEVIGEDNAFFFQAGSRNAILQAIEGVLSDPEAARKKSLRAAPSLLARHNWEAAAVKTLDAYKTFLK